MPGRVFGEQHRYDSDISVKLLQKTLSEENKVSYVVFSSVNEICLKVAK